MREYFIVKIKEDGKIEIPLEFAYELGLIKGAYFLVEVDTDIKEMHVERVALPGKKLVEIEMVVEDKPGVLAKVSGLLGRFGINILFNEAEELESLGLSAIVAIVDVSESKISTKELEDKLKEIEEVREVKVIELESSRL
ncbi:ACT domain-containing protein [Pyrococcus sp. ST04]|uniref:ACT domain-containing protein n=1 Tax=Pyrococcus sp. ST04 TaxID=1183377 RepID=UPI0002605E5F|nr:ACT domain-containing protein [Pyrococcus sp. ST04]AFK22579.1 putative acetolactate synthase small subunit [Pyrococcus sp. ST04]